MTHRDVARVCAVACGVILLAGCGSSSSKTTPAAGGSPLASPSATPASVAQLQKIVLQPSDLPTGWKGAPFKANPNHVADQAAMVKCVGARNTDSDKVAEAHSEDFALRDARISSSAST
jgi:hypothetical protein